MEQQARQERVDDARPSERRTGGEVTSERCTDDVVRRRALAFVVDTLVVSGATFAASSGLVRSRVPRIALTAVGSAVAGLFYHILLEGTYGQTVGKKLLAIAVVRENGEPCTYTAATVRTLLRFVDWLPVAYLLGFVAIGLTERHQRLGDLLAGTVVVRTDYRRGDRD